MAEVEDLILFAEEMAGVTECNSDAEGAHMDADKLLVRLIRYLNGTGVKSPLVDGILRDYEQLERWYS